ncbi:diguanylate cyclase [Psychromonas sp.]|nr:diguanylate cyclase [Psychromonas sp.]
MGGGNEVAIYLGVSKGNLALKSILEKANASITQSEMFALKKKWLNINDLSKVEFTNQELDYLQSKQVLNMCIDPNWLPFEKIEKNKHIGMTAEYIKLFQKELPIPINLVNTSNWLETVEFSKQRKCDFVSIMTPSKERRAYFNFTKPLMKMPIVIATLHDKPFINDISNVISKKLGITEGFAYAEVLKEEYPTINLIEVKGAKDGLSKVQQGELYGFIGVLPAVGYSINEDYIGELKIAGKVNNTLAFPMATRVDEPLLNSIFNKLIAQIPPQENKDILNKWLSIKYEEQVNYTNVMILAGFLVCIILIILFKNRSINKINEQLESYIKIVDENVLTSSTDLNGKITYASRAFCEKTGYSREELIGKNHNIVKHEDTDARLYKGLWTRLSAGLVWKGEIKNKKKDGSFYWVDATISPQLNKNNQVIGYTSIRHDITDKKIIEELSITDALTNIYNRRHFNDIFPKYLNSLKRDHSLFSFLIMDVDFFKQYNDIYGHQEGDAVLRGIAKVLQSKVNRADDYCFRLGGEEFGLLFKSSNRDNILNFVESIREAIEGLHIEHTGNRVSKYVTVSIGLYSDFVNEHHNTEGIFKEADDLLYKAKENGRNQTMFNVIPF